MGLFDSLERAVMAATEAVLGEYGIRGFWNPPGVSFSRRFPCEVCGLICIGNRAQGIVALGLPRGLAEKLTLQSNRGLYLDETSLKELVVKLCSNLAEHVRRSPHCQDLSLKVLHTANTNRWCRATPIPRRVLHFISSQGNVTLETYLQRIPYFTTATEQTALWPGCREDSCKA